MKNKAKKINKNIDKNDEKLLLSDVSISKLPSDVMSFLNELDDFTDPYNANYIGSRMSNKLNDILEKYS